MEQWLPAYGFEQTHEVSNQGRVRSRNKVLAQRLRPDGYLDTCLRAAGKTHTKTIHRLVAMAFVPGDNALTINHKDGIKTNNAEDNLEWVTPLENIRHACNTGLRAALTDAKRAELFADYLVGGHTQQALATKYGIAPQNIALQLKALRPSRPKRAVAEHGTKGMYDNHGCRCGPCKEAGSEYAKQYRKLAKHPAPSEPCYNPLTSI
jgi:hypothetical protein